MAETGQVYCLYGDIGAGKTVFGKGFAKGLLVGAIVGSPTFTILREYHDGRLPLYHFDAYRIMDPDEMRDIGYDEYIDGSGVILIEWADNIREILPDARIDVNISGDMEKGDNYRKIEIEHRCGIKCE